MAIQELCRRFSPETRSLHLIHQADDYDKLDYSKFTDQQLRQLDAILEEANAQPPASEGGDGTPKAA